MKISGDNNQVAITQTGSGNTLKLGIQTSTSSTNPSVTYSQTGNNALATIDSNGDGTMTSGSNTISITQVGNAGITDVGVFGLENTVNSLQTGGNNNTFTATVIGDQNTITNSNTGGGGNATTITQTGDMHTATVTTIGATNVTNIIQSGSTSGNTATVSINGSGNTTAITQTGTAGNNIASYTGTGSGNTVNLVQTNR
jgi:hypothetical protein